MMLNAESIERAVALLGAARIECRQLQEFPYDCAPQDEASAYIVQEALCTWLSSRGYGEIIGYKVGLVSASMRSWLGGLPILGVDEPVYSGIMSSCLVGNGLTVPFGRFIRPYVEGEIGVRLNADVPAELAPFNRDSIAVFVGECFAAIELVDWRLQYFECNPPLAPLMIADGGCNWGAVVGGANRDWSNHDVASLRAAMYVDGKLIGNGVGADLQGHPFEVLAWLSNKLASQGRGLRAGQIVLLGAVTPSYKEFDRGSVVSVRWDVFGEASVRFA